MSQPFYVDAAVEQTVRSMLASMPGGEGAYIDVAASNGVVRLDGTVSDGPSLARFKSQVASAMPGVTIDDRTEWVLRDCAIGRA